MSNITTIDKPRCSRCNAFRPEDELNGYDPLAPIGQRYRRAYCRNLAQCNSRQADFQFDQLIEAANKVT